MSDIKYVNTEGQFKCRVLKPKYGWFDESSTGTPSIRLPLEVIENNSQRGFQSVCHCYLSEKAFDNTIKGLCRAFPAWDGNLDALEKGDFTFEGLETDICFHSETYNGKERIKAQLPNKGEGISKDKIQKIVSMSDKSMAIVNAEKSNTEDSDIPF